ncbi:hypothetical protein LTR67_008048 [Exophiala xenobiotica]
MSGIQHVRSKDVPSKSHNLHHLDEPVAQLRSLGRTKGSNPALAAKLLSIISPQNTFQRETPGYEVARSAYWNKTQAEATPLCIYQPRTAGEVSLVLVILRYTLCPFAVKAGGHGKFNGESSINDGVLIDLAQLNHIIVAEDHTTVAVGPGNRWSSVYAAIEPLGITVVGGRAASVGVGGFLLGGGISWYSNLYGWGSDNIRSYQVVLGDGTIVTASKDSYPDLYKALRGGAGNFGIVTSFNLEARPYTGMWGGEISWDYSQSKAVQQAFLRTGAISDSADRKSFFILALTSNPEKEWIWGSAMYYCDAVKDPQPFHEALQIPAVENTCAVLPQTEHVTKMSAAYPHYLQHTFWVIATKVDPTILRFCADTWTTELQPILDTVEGFKGQLAIQYITAGVIEGAARNGGNTLGLAGTEPFIMLNAEPSWNQKSDNHRVFAAIDRAFRKMVAEAKRTGQYHEYLYSNYASEYQHPIGSYGEEARGFMQQVASKYDPDRVFQDLRGAGFKLAGAPKSLRSLHETPKL